jgi:bifunctional enzyme CysN/CysC
VFQTISDEYRSFASGIGLQDVTAIPLSALRGDNITERSPHTPWYSGPTLIDHLETVEIDEAVQAGPFRMPIQWVNRPDHDFRGFCGRVVRGTVHPGDPVRALPSGRRTSIARVILNGGDVDEAVAGESVTLTLTDEIDVSRGDVLASEVDPPEVADQFEAHIVWMSEHPMLPGRPYLLKIGTRTVGATLAHPKYKVNVNTMEHTAAATLDLNDIGVGNINLDRPIAFDPYTENREMGGFILIDRFDNATVGAGLLHFALRRSANIHWQAVEVDKEARSVLKAQRPALIWLTGLSGAGKSTIANIVERKLHRLGRHTYLLDGDNVRHGLNKDLGFTDADRVENIRRIAEVSSLMVDAGLIVIASFISPFRAEREFARSCVREGEFIEVFVDTPLAVAESRDPKGLFRKARRGELFNFTGVDSPYEQPADPELRIETTQTLPEDAADAIIAMLPGRAG